MKNKKPKKPVPTHPLALALADSRGSTRREVGAWLEYLVPYFVAHGAKNRKAARDEAMEFMRSVAGCDLTIPAASVLEGAFAELEDGPLNRLTLDGFDLSRSRKRG